MSSDRGAAPMVAAIMRGLADMLPFENINRVRSLANALAAAGDYELEEQWPK